MKLFCCACNAADTVWISPCLQPHSWGLEPAVLIELVSVKNGKSERRPHGVGFFSCAAGEQSVHGFRKGVEKHKAGQCWKIACLFSTLGLHRKQLWIKTLGTKSATAGAERWWQTHSCLLIRSRGLLEMSNGQYWDWETEIEFISVCR